MQVHRRSQQRGFTLVELLAVIAVLGVLAAIVVFAVGSTSDQAHKSACATERSEIKTALERFKLDNQAYPSAGQGLASLATGAFYLRSAPSSSKWIYDPSGDVVGVGDCLSLASPSTPKLTGTVTVFAATSLTNVFNDIKAKLAAVDPGLTINYSFGGSNTLKAQINSGSPADVFAAADTLNAPNAPLVGSNQLFASNKLAIITRPGNPAGIGELGDLFSPAPQVVLCQTGVPCGTASDSAFATLGKTRAQVPHLVSETSNVGQVVTAVSLGGSNTVGIVYTTDASAAGSAVSTVTIPDANNAVNHYPIYRITSGAHLTEAQAFISYILSPEGQAFFVARGFGPP